MSVLVWIQTFGYSFMNTKMFLNWLNFKNTFPLSEIAEAELCNDITPRGELWKQNFVKTLSLGGISEAELHEDIHSERTELWKPNCEDIPHNSRIEKLGENIPF